MPRSKALTAGVRETIRLDGSGNRVEVWAHGVRLGLAQTILPTGEDGQLDLKNVVLYRENLAQLPKDKIHDGTTILGLKYTLRVIGYDPTTRQATTLHEFVDYDFESGDVDVYDHGILMRNVVMRPPAAPATTDPAID